MPSMRRPQSCRPFGDQPNLIRLRTFSKVYGLAGMRIGYAIADARVIATMEKIRQHFGVTRLSAVAALAALQDHAFRHFRNGRNGTRGARNTIALAQSFM